MNKKPDPMIAVDREIIAEEGLRGFIEYAWPLIEPADLMWNWHIDAICEHLEAVSRDELRKLIINIPPGSMKSLSVSVFWPAWEWTWRPSERFMFASYDAGLSRRDAARMRDVVESPWYQDRWGPIRFKDAQSGVGEFYNEQGGMRLSTSIKGKITGRHVNKQVVDDPIKPIEVTGSAAVAQAALETVSNWWRGTMSTRKLQRSARIIIMQRLHEGDLAGLMIEEGDYTLLRLPMRCEIDDLCVTRWFRDPRKEGELLWPERFPEEEVRTLERDLGPQAAAAQLQQSPAPAAGDIFKRDYISYHSIDFSNLGPKDKYRFTLSWDCTFKESKRSDYVVGQVWASRGSDCYLVDQVRKKMGFAETCKAIRNMKIKWPKARSILIEDKANGSAIIETLSKDMQGIIPVNPSGGKESRAAAVEPMWEAGNVHIPDPKASPWVIGFEKELLTFPSAKHDDQVDAMTQSLVYLHKRAGGRLRRAMARVMAEG